MTFLLLLYHAKSFIMNYCSWLSFIELYFKSDVFHFQAIMSKKVSLPSLQSFTLLPSATTNGKDHQGSSSEEDFSSSSGKHLSSKNELTKRLVSMAPKLGAVNPEALKFVHNTKSQARTRKLQQPIKLEPLVG